MAARAHKHIDTVLLTLVLVLVGGGFFIFSSASLGLLARDGASFSSIAFSQITFGIIGGFVALAFFSHLHYRHLRKFAFYIFLFSLILTALVFVPGLGMTHAGATRWLDFGAFTFQPSEILKYGFVIYLATWLSGMYRHAHKFLAGALPFAGLVALVAGLLLMQPDTDTFIVIGAAGTAMFFVAGGRTRDIAVFIVLGVVLVGILALTRPYIMDRITSFVDPSADPHGAGYQVQQSLIAIGSGGTFGRGYGQSIQKFEYLPEPIGDSVFSVYAEEFGFAGSALLVFLFAAFTFRGYRIASHAQDLFGMLLVVGIITLIIVQAFLNISAMLGVAPMLGLTLPFVSHGGSALLATLAGIGIVLNVSKYQTKAK